LSTDGIAWTLKGITNLTSGAAYHVRVVYDASAFGGGAYHYKAWFWNGNPNVVVNIYYAESNDGFGWNNIQLITQGSSPIVDGVSPGWFYHLYGPAAVMYNANATSTPGAPFTYPYIMMYHISTEGLGPGTSIEQTGLAISTDGLLWNRWTYANGTSSYEPIIIPQGVGSGLNLLYNWDGGYAFVGSMIVDPSGTMHAFYSGANPNIAEGLSYGQGIGHATSMDGINWILEPLSPNKPILYFTDGFQAVPSWRSGRTYAPFVLLDTFGGTDLVWKMWFTGGLGTTAGTNQAIGYATKPF